MRKSPQKTPLPEPDGDLLKAVVRSMAEGVVITDDHLAPPGPRIVFANESFAALSGWAVGDLPGRLLAGFYGPRTDRLLVGQFEEAMHAGRAFTCDLALYRRNGDLVFVNVSLNPVLDKGGAPRHFVAIYRDITDLRRLQDALLQSTKLEAVGQLAGGVAHDFNNLLSVINGYCEMLAERLNANGPAMQDVMEIHKAGLKAASLTRQLLAFSRRQVMDPKILNLNIVIREIREMLAHLVGPKVRIQFRLNHILANVRADPVQIQQVLLNLMINARDAMPDGGRIVVRTGNKTVKPSARQRLFDVPPGVYATFSVTDTGCGMDEATRAHLFEPFFTTKEMGRGTGLGLSTAYGIVRQSSGYITARTRVGKGSTFEIYLPVVLATAEPFETGIDARAGTRGSETILLVENDEVVRKMISGILSSDGYRVFAAKDGGEAAAHLPAIGHAPDLLVTDIAPGGKGQSGLQLAEQLRQRKPGLKVLFMSGLEPDAAVRAGFGPDTGFVRKPFALNTLMTRLRELLDTGGG